MKKTLAIIFAVIMAVCLFTGCDEVAQTVVELTRDTWFAYDYTYTNDSVSTELICYFIYAPEGISAGKSLKADIPAGLSIVIVAGADGEGAAGSLAEALADEKYIYKTFAKGDSIYEKKEGDSESLANKFVVGDTLWTVLYTSVLKGKEWDYPPVALQKGTSDWEEITDLESLKDVFSLKGLLRSVLLEYLLK